MKQNWKSLVITLGVTFILMLLLVIYTTRSIYKTSFSYVHEIGEDKTSAITAELENYLEKASSVMWVTADTVDHMVNNGASDTEIIEYITRESANTEAQFDETYTGIYGVICGNYVDGVGWTPPEGYDPTARDWYQTIVAANGQPIIVSPYVDAQTGNVIISVGKSLTDPNDVLAMDLTLSGVQETTENININGHGYGFILNYDGMVIAHNDTSLIGSYFDQTEEQREFFEKIISVGKGNFETTIDGERCTVFVDEVHEQWHLVVITRNSELFTVPRNLLIVNIIVSILVFGLMSMFYIIGYRYERKVNRRMEEMKEVERKREYEATVLKLEKSAADTANKAKSDFLADMSHEIRTPINAVLGMNEMILRESKDDTILDYAANIKSAGNTLLSIINTILDFSKIEDGRMNLVPVEFDVNELISGLLNSISERARSKFLDLKVEVDENIPVKLMGDDVRIAQVIMNLLTNAVKYTEKGSVTLRVLESSRKDDRIVLHVEVEDTGIGIKEEDLDKLYISFERIEEKRNRHIEGTGLGISIVTKLLTMMGSKLNVESRYGIGSKFYFDLPLQITDSTPVGKFDEKRNSTPKTSGKKITLRAPEARILVTDDNDMNRKVAFNLLKLFDIRPVLASSGKETIEILRKEKFDILFLDHMMPEMDGIETLKAIKDEGLIGDMTVIALTANAVVGAREQYLEAGFDGYLSKPIDIDELEKILSECLEIEEPDDEPQVFEFAPDDGSSAAGSSLTVDHARTLGLDVDAGIGYAAGDVNFYLEILKDYATDCPGRCNELTTYLKNEDWKNYNILVHSIKSGSKTVGANAVSLIARMLEESSGSGDASYVKAHHSELIEAYSELAGKILVG
ncbi:MAG: response regulator [Clostridiales bacterium]|nr:response regulator [Clostridiales bacterium]